MHAWLLFSFSLSLSLSFIQEITSRSGVEDFLYAVPRSSIVTPRYTNYPRLAETFSLLFFLILRNKRVLCKSAHTVHDFCKGLDSSSYME